MSELSAPEPPRRRVWVSLVLALAVVGLFALFFGLRLHEQFNLDVLASRRAAFDALVANNLIIALVLFVATYAAVVSLSLPVSIYLTLAGGYLFGTWLGGFASVCGGTMGASLLFIAAKTGLGDLLRRHAGRWMQRFEAGFRDNAFNYVLALRLVQVFPFWVINLTPAFFRMKLHHYAAATFLGILPGTLVFASVGDALHAALDAGAALDPVQAGVALLYSPQVIGPLLGLAALALLPVIVKRLRRRAA